MKTFYYYANSPKRTMIALIVFQADSREIADAAIKAQYKKEDNVKFAAEK